MVVERHWRSNKLEVRRIGRRSRILELAGELFLREQLPICRTEERSAFADLREGLSIPS